MDRLQLGPLRWVIKVICTNYNIKLKYFFNLYVMQVNIIDTRTNPPTTFTFYPPIFSFSERNVGSLVSETNTTQSYDTAPANEVAALVAMMVSRLIKPIHPLLQFLLTGEPPIMGGGRRIRLQGGKKVLHKNTGGKILMTNFFKILTRTLLVHNRYWVRTWLITPPSKRHTTGSWKGHGLVNEKFAKINEKK